MKKIIAFFLVLALSLTVFCAVPAGAVSKSDPMWGIDVSEHQGQINWTSVKNAGVEFAILRAWCWDKDIYFDANYAGATAAGIPVGAYMYIYADTVAEAEAEVQNLLDAIAGKIFEFPIYIDVEDSSYHSMSKSLLTQIVATEIEALENAGYYAAYYTGKNFAETYLDLAALADYDCWIAQYASTCTYTGAHNMWQYSQTGSVSGISGNVDMNYAYLDYPTIIKNKGFNNFEKPKTVVSYNQNHSPWGSRVFGSGTIAATGCGIVSTCNALNYLNGCFDTTAKADAFIVELATWAYNRGAFNPGGADGTWRFNLYPYMEAQFGEKYDFTVDYYCGETSTASCVTQDRFINHLKNGGVTVSHVKGHFIAVVDYDSTTGKYLVLDSAPSNGRETKATGGITWMTATQLSGGNANMHVDWYCLISSTKTTTTPDPTPTPTPTPTVTYPYAVDDNTLMIYDGESAQGITTGFDTVTTLDTEKNQGNTSLKMVYTNPTGAASLSIGGMVHQSLDNACDLSDYEKITFDAYFSRKMEGSNGLQINFATSGEDGYNHMIGLDGKDAGWHTFTIELSQVNMAVSANWSDINNLRYTWFNYAQSSADTYILIDNVRAVKAATVPPVDEALQNVGDLIAALPAPEDVKPEHEAQIKQAKAAYDALTDAQKALVSNVAKLEQCLTALDKALQSKAKVDEVISAIEKLPLPGNVKHEHKEPIHSAKDLFDNLTEEQKTQVSNAQKLTEVLNVYDALEPVTTVTYGDINKDGGINAADALMALQSAVDKIELTDEQFTIADVDGNSEINASDALYILQKAVDKIQNFPVEK